MRSAASAAAPAPGATAGQGLINASASGGALTPDPSSTAWTITGNSSNVSLGNFTSFPLYTLDDTDGTTLMPNDFQLATLNGWVDLRAQVRDTTVSTYSWDTTGLGSYATNISGTSTYHLTFRWTNYVFTPHLATVTLTVTNNSSQTEVQTYSFWVPAGNLPAWSGGSGSAPSWAQSLTPDTVSAMAPHVRLAKRLGRRQPRRGRRHDPAAVVQPQRPAHSH